MRQTLKDAALICAVAGIVLFTNLGGPRLWDRDEPRNAGCAVEMLARGDWVVPWFNDELRTLIRRHQLGDSAGVIGAALLT